jgi:predicted metal-dependent phosphoesterase TrpH
MKGKAKKSTFKRAAVKKVKVAAQTDHVTNSPLKAATRGG